MKETYPIYGKLKFNKDSNTYEDYINFERNLLQLKYGNMAVKSFDFIESNLPLENFKELPIIPVVISLEDGSQEIITGLIDSGSTNSFIHCWVAKKIKAIVCDTMMTSGINSSIECKPVVSIKFSVESIDGWVEMNVGIIDTKHPNFHIILGRDFMEKFKSITFDFENRKTTLDY